MCKNFDVNVRHSAWQDDQWVDIHPLVDAEHDQLDVPPPTADFDEHPLQWPTAGSGEWTNDKAAEWKLPVAT